MATKSEIADVLERAADLYESDKADWCHGKWGGHNQDGSITVCASSALGLAAGIEVGHVLMLEDQAEAPSTPWTTGDMGITAPELLYLATRHHVDQVLGVRLPTWNDYYTNRVSIAGDASVRYVNGAFEWAGEAVPRIVTEKVPARSKEQVIELFKGLAKDLRNEE